MNQPKNICVFCGSSRRVDEKYIALARDAGTKIARAGFGIVYGGAGIGLMGALADAALKENGRVIGVIPHLLVDMEVAHKNLTETHLTHTMHERQVGMAERADAFLVLPGGLGTLAELFEVLTWKQLKIHNKPIAVLNAYGYWDSLLGFLDHGAAEKFLYPGDEGLFTVLENMDNLNVFLTGLKKGINSVLSDP